MSQPIRVPAMLGGDTLKKNDISKLENKAVTKTASIIDISSNDTAPSSHVQPAEKSELNSSLSLERVTSRQWSMENIIAPSPHNCSIFAADMSRLCSGLPVFYRYSAKSILPAYLLSISPRTRQAIVRVPSAYSIELLERFVTVPTSSLLLVPHFRQGGIASTLGTLVYSAGLKETNVSHDLIASSLNITGTTSDKLVEEIESAMKTICQVLQTAETNLFQKLIVPTRCNQVFVGALTPVELSRLGIEQHGYSTADSEPMEASGILDVEYSDVVSEISSSLVGTNSKKPIKKPSTIRIGSLYFSRFNSLFHHRAYTCLEKIVDCEFKRIDAIGNLTGLKRSILQSLSEEYLLSLTAVKNTLDIVTTKNAFVCEALLSQSGNSLFTTYARDNLVDMGKLYQEMSANHAALIKRLQNDYECAIRSTSSKDRFKACHDALSSSIKYEKRFQNILNKYLTMLLPKINLFVLSLGSIGDTDIHALIDAITCIFQFIETNSLQSPPFYNIVPFLDSLREEIVELAVSYSDCLIPSIYIDLIRLVLGANLYNMICASKDLPSNSKIISYISSLIKEEQLPSCKAELVMRLQHTITSSKNRKKKGSKLRTAQLYTNLNKFLVEKILSSVACIMCEEYVRTMRIDNTQQADTHDSGHIIKVYMLFVRVLANICAEEYADAALKWQTDMLEYMDVMNGRESTNPQASSQLDRPFRNSLQERLEALGLFTVDEEQDTMANIFHIELEILADINQNKMDISSLYTNPSPETITASLRELFFCALDTSNYLRISIEEFFKLYVARGIIPRDDLAFQSADVGSTKVIEEYKKLESQILTPLKDPPLDSIVSGTLKKMCHLTESKKSPFITAPGWKGAHDTGMNSISQQKQRPSSVIDIGKELASAYCGLISEADMLEYTQLSKTDTQLISGLLVRRNTLISEWLETIFRYQLDYENQCYQKVALTNDDIYGYKPFLDMCSECDSKISVSPAPEPAKALFDDLFDSLIGITRLTCDILIDEIGLNELRKLADKTVLQQACPIMEEPQPAALPPLVIFNLNMASYNLAFLSKDDTGVVDVKNQKLRHASEVPDSSEEFIFIDSTDVDSRSNIDIGQLQILTFNDVELLLQQKPSFLAKLIHNATTLVSKTDEFLLNNIISLPALIGNKVIRFNNVRFKIMIIETMCALRKSIVDHTHSIMETVTAHLFRVAVLTESVIGKDPKSPDDLSLMINGLECHNDFVKSWIPTGISLIDMLIELRHLESGYLDFLSIQTTEPADARGTSCLWGSFSALYSRDIDTSTRVSAIAESGITKGIHSIQTGHVPHTSRIHIHSDDIPDDILSPLPADLLSCFASTASSTDTSNIISDAEFAATLDYFNNAPHRSFNVQSILAKIFKITGLQKIARHIIKSQTRTFARHLLKLGDWVSDTTAMLHEYCKEVMRMTYRDIFLAQLYPRQFKQSFFFLTKDLNIPFLDDNFEVLEDELVTEFLESIQAYVKDFQLLRSPTERSRLRMSQPLTRATIRTAAVQESLHNAPRHRRFGAQYFRPTEDTLLCDFLNDDSSIDLNNVDLFNICLRAQKVISHPTFNGVTKSDAENNKDVFSLTSSSTSLKIADLATAQDNENKETSPVGLPNFFYSIFEIFNELLYISDVLDQIHQVSLRWANYLGLTLNLADNPTEIISIIRPAAVLITSLYEIKQRYMNIQTRLLRDTDVSDFMALLSEAAQAIVIGKQNPAFRLWSDTIQAAEADLTTLGPKVFYLHCLSSPTLTATDFKQLSEELSLPITEDKLIPNSQLLNVSDLDYALRLARMVFTRAEKSTKTLSQLAEIDLFLQNLQIFPCELVVHINLSAELGVLFNKWQNSDTIATIDEKQPNDQDESQDAPVILSAVPPRGASRRGAKLTIAPPHQSNNESDAKNKQNISASSSSNMSKGVKSRALSRLGALKLNVDESGIAEGLSGTSDIPISHLGSESRDNLFARTSDVPASGTNSMTPNSMLSHTNKTVLPFIQVHSGIIKVIREALFFVADILARNYPYAVQKKARQLEVQLLLIRSAIISINRISMLLPELLYILPRLTIVRNGVQDMSFLSLYNDFGDYKKTIFNTLNVLREANKLSNAHSNPGSFLMLIINKPQVFTQLSHCTYGLSNILENVYSRVLSTPMIPHYNSKPVACALLLPKIPSIFYSIFSLQENLNVLYYCPAVYQSVLPNFDRVLLGNPRNMSYQDVGLNKKGPMHILPHLSSSDVIIIGIESGFERLYFEYGLRAPQELFLLSGMLNDMRLHREGLLREHKRAFLLLISLRISELLCQCLYQSIAYALTAVFCLHLDGNVDHFFTLKFTIFEQLKRCLTSPELHDSLEQKVDYSILSPEYKVPEIYINTIRRELFGLTGPMSNDDELLARSVEKVAKIQYYKQRRCQRYLCFKAIAARVFEYDQLLNLIICKTIEYYNSYYADAEAAAQKGSRKTKKNIKVDPIPQPDFTKTLSVDTISNLRTIFTRVHESNIHRPIIVGSGYSLSVETNKILSSLAYGFVSPSVIKDENTDTFAKPLQTPGTPPSKVMMTAEDAALRGVTRGFGRSAVNIVNSNAGASKGKVSEEKNRSDSNDATESMTFTQDYKLFVGSSMVNLGPHYLGKATALDSLPLNYKQLAIVAKIIVGFIQRKPVFIYSDRLRGYNLIDTKIIAQYTSRLLSVRHIFLSLTSYTSADQVVLQIISYFMAGYGVYLHGLEFLSTEHHARLIDYFNTMYLARGSFPIVKYQSGGSVPGELALNDFTTCMFTGHIVIILPELIYHDDGTTSLSTTGKNITDLFNQTKIEAFLDSFGSGLAASATKLNTLLTGAFCNLSVLLNTNNKQSPGLRLTNERGDIPDGKPRCKILTQLYGTILTDFLGIAHFDPILLRTSYKYFPNSETFIHISSNHVLYHLFKKKGEAHAEYFYEICLLLNAMQSACPKLYPDDADIIYKRARDATNIFSVAISTVLLLVSQVYSISIRDFIIRIVASAFRLTNAQLSHINKIVASLNKLLNLSKEEPTLKKAMSRDIPTSRSHVYESAIDYNNAQKQDKQHDNQLEDNEPIETQTEPDTFKINYTRSPTASLSQNIWSFIKQTLSPQYVQFCEAAAEQANIIGPLGADILLTCLEFLQVGPCALFSNNKSVQVLECYATIISKFGRLQPFFIHSINDLHHHSDTIRRLGSSSLVIFLINDTTGNLGPSLYGALLAFMNPVPHISMTSGVELDCELSAVFNASHTGDSVITKYGRPKVLVITTGSFLEDKMLSTPMGLIPHRIVIDSSVMRTDTLIKLLILNSFKLSSTSANHMLDYIHEQMTRCTIDNIENLETAKEYFRKMCAPPCTDEKSAMQAGLRRLRFISHLFYILVLQYFDQATTVFSMAPDLRGWRILRSTFFYYLVCCKVCVFKPPDVRSFTAEQLAEQLVASNQQLTRKIQYPSSTTNQNKVTPPKSPSNKSFSSTTSRYMDTNTASTYSSTNGSARSTHLSNPSLPVLSSRSDLTAIPGTPNVKVNASQVDSPKVMKETAINIMNNMKPDSEFQFLAHTTINLSHVWCAEHIGSFSSALAMFGERRFTFFDISLSDEFLIEYVYKAESYEQACFNILCPVFAAVWTSISLTYVQYTGGKVHKLSKLWMKYLNFHSKHTIPLLLNRFSNDKVLQKSLETCLTYIEESLPPEYPYEQYKYAYLAVVTNKGAYMQYTSANSAYGSMPTKRSMNPVLRSARHKSDYNATAGTVVPPLTTGPLAKHPSRATSAIKERSARYSQIKFLPYKFGQNMLTSSQTENYVRPTSVHKLALHFDMLRSQLIFFIAICILGGVSVHLLGPRYSGKTTLIRAAHSLIHEYSVMQLYLPSTCEPNKLFLADAARELYLINGNELRFPGTQIIHMHFSVLFLDNGKFEKAQESVLDKLTKHAGLDIVALFLGERVLPLNSPGNISISPESDSHQSLLGTADAPTVSITFESEFCPPQLQCSQFVNIVAPDTGRAFLIDLLLNQRKYLDLTSIMHKISCKQERHKETAAIEVSQTTSNSNICTEQDISSLNELSTLWIRQLIDGILLVKDQIPVSLLRLLAEIKRLSIFATDQPQDIQMHLFTASSVFLALRFISEITAPTIISIIDALRGSLAMGKLCPIGPWGILNSSDTTAFAKANKLLDLCGVTNLQMELSWETETLRIARDNSQILEDSEDSGSDSTVGDNNGNEEISNDQGVSEVAKSYSFKPQLRQPPTILRSDCAKVEKRPQVAADPSLTTFEEATIAPQLHMQRRSYIEMRKKLKILLGLKAFRGVKISTETSLGLRQSSNEIFQAYIQAFNKYVVTRCSPGLANRIFTVHLTIQYDLEFREKSVSMMLQSLRNPHDFRKQYGDSALEHFSRLQLDVITTVLRKQDISSSLLDIVLMLSSFGSYKLYGGRALIKLLLRIPSSGVEQSLREASPGTITEDTTDFVDNKKDTDKVAHAALSNALESVKKNPADKDRTQSSSSTFVTKTKLARYLDIKARDTLEIERQLEKYSAFDIDDTTQTQTPDESPDQKTYRIILSVDVFLTQQNLDLGDEVADKAADLPSSDLNISAEKAASSQLPSVIFDEFIKSLITTVGRRGEAQMVYYLLRGVFLLALQINPMLALKSVTFVEGLQFCKVNKGVNPDIKSSTIIGAHLREFFAAYNISLAEHIWIEPRYSLFVVSSLAHLQHVDSLNVIHGLSSLGHAGNISLRLFTPAELITLCLLTSERYNLGVVIDVSTLISIASRNLAILLIADMPTPIGMKLPESPVLRHFTTDISAVSAQIGSKDTNSTTAITSMSRAVSFSIANTSLVRKSVIVSIPLLLLAENQRYFSLNRSYFTLAAGHKQDIVELDAQGKRYRGARYLHILATTEALAAATLHVYLFITANLLPDTIFLTFEKFAELSKTLYEQRVAHYSAFLHSCDTLLHTIKLLNTGIYCQIFSPTIRENIIAYKDNLTLLKNYIYTYYKRALVLLRNAPCDCPAAIARVYAGSLRKDAIASDEAFEVALSQHLKTTGFDKLSIIHTVGAGGFADTMFGFSKTGLDVITDTYLRDITDKITYMFDDCDMPFTDVSNSEDLIKTKIKTSAPGKNYSEILIARNSTLPFNLTAFPSAFLGICLDSFYPQWDVGMACYLTRFIFFANSKVLQEILSLIIAISMGTRLCFIENALTMPFAIVSELHFITTTPHEYEERKEELDACRGSDGHYTLESLAGIVYWINAAQSVATFNLELAKAFSQEKAIGFTNVLFETITQLNVHQTNSHENEIAILNIRTLMALFKAVGSRVSDKKTSIKINGIHITPMRPLHDYRYYIGLAQGTKFSSIVSSGIVSFEIINSSILIQPKYSNINLYLKYLKLQTADALELQMVQTYNFAVDHLQNVLLYLTTPLEKTRTMMSHRLLSSTADLIRLLKRSSEINSKFIIDKHGSYLEKAVMNPNIFIHLIEDEDEGNDNVYDQGLNKKRKKNRQQRADCDELTFLLTTPVSYFDLELAMRLCEKSISFANFRIQLEHEAADLASKAEFSKHCARGMVSILIICQKLSCVMPTLARIFTDHFFSHFFLYLHEQIETPQWKNAPLPIIISHILLPYINIRVYRMVPRFWGMPICDLMSFVFSCALSECSTDNLQLLKFILSPDLREKAIRVSPFYNSHDQQYQRARELMNTAPFSFQASIATNYTWKNISILYPHSERILSWLDYFTRNNFMFVNLVTSLNPYKIILGHYIFKETQHNYISGTDDTTNTSTQSYTLPLFTEECITAYHSNTELPLPTDLQVPCYNNILQSLVFSLSITQLNLSKSFKLFGAANRLCSFREEIESREEILKDAHKAYCKNQNLIPELTYTAAVGIAWYVIMVCGYIPEIETIGQSSYIYDPAKCIKPMLTTDTRYERKMSSKSYADGIGSRTLVIFYEEGMNILDLVTDRLERSLFDQLGLAPCVITSRPTEDDFRTKTVIVDASVDAKETIDRLIVMYNKGWRAASLLVVLIPVHVGQFYAEEAIFYKDNRARLLEHETGSTNAATSIRGVRYSSLSYSLGVFMSVSSGARYYIEGPKTLSDSIVYLLTISLCIFRKHGISISSLSRQKFELYYSLLLQNALLKSNRGYTYFDSRFLTSLLHFIGMKKAEGVFQSSANLVSEYILASRSQEDVPTSARKMAGASPSRDEYYLHKEAYLSIYCNLFGPHTAITGPSLAYLSSYYSQNVPRMLLGMPCKWHADTSSVNLVIDGKFDQTSLALTLARARARQGDGNNGEIEDVLLDIRNDQQNESSEPLSSLSISSTGSNVSTLSTQNTHASEGASILTMHPLNDDIALMDSRLEVTAAELTAIVPHNRKVIKVSCDSKTTSILKLPSEDGEAAIEYILKTLKRYEYNVILKDKNQTELSPVAAEQLTQLTAADLSSLEALKYQLFNMVPIMDNNALCNRIYRELFSIGLSQEVIAFLDGRPVYKNMFADTTIQQEEADLLRSVKTVLYLSDGYCQTRHMTFPYFKTCLTEHAPVIKLYGEMYWEIRADIYQHVLGNIFKWAMFFNQPTSKAGERRRKTFILLANRPTVIQQYKIDNQNSLVFSINTTKKKKLDKKAREKPDTDIFTVKLTGLRLFNIAYDPIEDTIADTTPESILGYTQTYTFYAVLIDTDYCEYSNSYLNRTELRTAIDLYKFGLIEQTTEKESRDKEDNAVDIDDNSDDLIGIGGASCCSIEEDEAEVCFVSIPVIIGGAISGIQLFLKNKTGMRPLDVSIKGAYCSTGYLY